MSYDEDVDLPEDAQAVIIAPSIVGDRYVQITPVYTGGDTLADGATLATDNTSVPLELDQIYSSLNDLNVALGPDGANKNGALTDLLEVTADNFGGQGEQFNQTISDFSQLSQTLEDNKEELFGSAAQLEEFVSTLAQNDSTVRAFNQSLSNVSTMLNGESEELAAALRNLSVALGEVTTFVKDNKASLSRNIKGINRVAKVLVKQRAALEETLINAPIALNNLALTYNPQAGTLDTNANLGHLEGEIASNPALVLCTFVEPSDPIGGAVRRDRPDPAAGRGVHAGDRLLEQRDLRPDPRWPRGGGPMSRRANRTTRLVRAVAAALVGTVVLSGCDFDVYELPLPGGTDTGDDADHGDGAVRGRARPGAAVVGQGQRRQRRQGDRRAARRLHRRGHPRAPQRRRAPRQRDRRDPPDQPARREVRVPEPARRPAPAPSRSSDGDTIELADTGRNPEVEEVLGALSLLLNGGGVAQLKLITQELNKALTGREDAARSVLTQIENFTGSLDDNKADIVAAIEALDRLARATRGQQDDINSALDELPSALTSIDGQRADLVKMLQALNELGDVGVRVIKASKEATIDSITQLQPVLTELANSGDAFVKAFHVFLTYPFVDEVVGRDPQVARNLHMGDYTNLSVTLDIDLTEGLPDPPGIPNIPCIELGADPAARPAAAGRASCARASSTRSTSASPTRRSRTARDCPTS